MSRNFESFMRRKYSKVFSLICNRVRFVNLVCIKRITHHIIRGELARLVEWATAESVNMRSEGKPLVQRNSKIPNKKGKNKMGKLVAMAFRSSRVASWCR